MRSTTVSMIAFAASGAASALFPPPLNCAFTLTAHGPGSANGQIGQLADGQNRIGGGHPAGSYHYSNGTIPGFLDAKNRGCILTPPTTQWQCDEGVGPSPGFHVNCDGSFQYKGHDGFWACPVNDHGEWNVYTHPVAGQKKCVAIEIAASGNCDLGCNKPATPTPSTMTITTTPSVFIAFPPTRTIETISTVTLKFTSTVTSTFIPPPFTTISFNSTVTWKTIFTSTTDYWCSTPTTTKPTPTFWTSYPSVPTNKTDCHGEKPCKCEPDCDHTDDGKGKDCPVDLNGSYEFPHLIVPLDKYNPDKVHGNRLNGTITPAVCSAFNFDIHPDHAGKTCSLIFLLPLQKDLETSAYEFSGEGSLTFNKLIKPVEQNTTWNTKGMWQHLSTKAVWPGSSTLAWSGPCEAGEKVSFEVCSEGITLEYFQDWNPSPIGLYLREC